MPRCAKLWLLVCSIWLAACGAQLETPSTEEIVRVGITADLVESVLQPIREYQEVDPSTRIQLVTLASLEREEALEDGEVDLLFSADLPKDDYFATPLMREGIAIVLNSAVSVRDFQLEELQAIFSGMATDWGDLDGTSGEIQPVILQSGSETREVLRAILPDIRFSTAALLAPHPVGVMEIIQEGDGAIGFVPVGSLDEGVGIGSIDGVRPSAANILSGSYPLTMEIHAYALEEPTGAARDFLVWWQSR
jgi:phosphate transport system substrate-binding protein